MTTPPACGFRAGGQHESRPRTEGFTLMELMVAMALAAILIGMIVTVSTNAQQIYDETSARVEVLQKARYVLNDMRGQLQQALPTSDLEFFVDRAGGNLGRNGHWDEGEELKDSAAGPNLVGGRPQKNYYDEAAHILEREYFTEQFGVSTKHANFSIYFRAPTVVRGEQRVANIEYYLADPRLFFTAGESGKLGRDVENNEDLILVKVVRYIDTDQSSFHNQELKVKEERFELCPNITDFKVEYYYDNFSDRRPGEFLTPKEEYERDREDEGFKSELKITRESDLYIKEFIYGGYRERELRGTVRQGRRNLRAGVLEQPYFRVGDGRVYFSELKQGDQIYIWTDSGGGSQFPSGDYTVLRRQNDAIYFKEQIDTSSWDADQGGLRYKAGYLPSAFRVTVRVLNNSGREPRNISMVVHTVNKRP